MLHFSGNEALEIVRGKDIFNHFIFVSGTMGEDLAIEGLLRGATDYVLKTIGPLSDLMRLFLCGIISAHRTLDYDQAQTRTNVHGGG